MTWEARNSERDPNAWDVFSDEGVLLFRGTWERDGKRAKLAAAAPQMYQALQELIAEANAPVGWEGHNGNTAGFQFAKDAIAKAEGR